MIYAKTFPTGNVFIYYRDSAERDSTGTVITSSIIHTFLLVTRIAKAFSSRNENFLPFLFICQVLLFAGHRCARQERERKPNSPAACFNWDKLLGVREPWSNELAISRFKREFVLTSISLTRTRVLLRTKLNRSSEQLLALPLLALENFTFLHYVRSLRLIAGIFRRLERAYVQSYASLEGNTWRIANHFYKCLNNIRDHRDIKCRRAPVGSKVTWGRRKGKRAESVRIGGSEFVVGRDIPCLWWLIKNDRSRGSHHLRPRRTIESTGSRRRILRGAYRFIHIRGSSPPLKGLKPTTRSPFWPPVLSYIANHRTGGRPFAHTTTGATIESSILDPRLRNSRAPGDRRRWRSNASSGCLRSSITGDSNLVSIFRD